MEPMGTSYCQEGYDRYRIRFLKLEDNGMQSVSEGETTIDPLLMFHGVSYGNTGCLLDL